MYFLCFTLFDRKGATIFMVGAMERVGGKIQCKKMEGGWAKFQCKQNSFWEGAAFEGEGVNNDRSLKRYLGTDIYSQGALEIHHHTII